MNNLKICMMTYALSPEHSGAAIQAVRLAKYLTEKKGVEIFFLSQCAEKENLKYNNIEGFNVIRIFKGTLFFKILAPFNFFYKLFKKRKDFDVIHVHGVGYIGKIAIVFGTIFNKKVIFKMTMLGEDDAISIKRGKNRKINFWFFSKASHYIAITSNFYKSCIEASIPEYKISLIPNAVDTRKFFIISNEKKNQIREKLNLPSNKKILVYGGIIRPEKGIDFLLDVIVKVSKVKLDTMLLLMGPTENWVSDDEKKYIKEVLERIENLTRQGIALYVGKKENVNEYLQASDIFISASKREGLQNILLEAMACGLPSIVIEIPGVHENILSDGVDGFILKERDLDLFSNKINYLLNFENIYRKFSLNAVEKIKNQYSLVAISEKYINLYNDLIKATK